MTSHVKGMRQQVNDSASGFSKPVCRTRVPAYEGTAHTPKRVCKKSEADTLIN